MSGSTDGKLTDDDLAGLAQWHDKLARDAIFNCEAEETDEATDIWAGLCSSHEEEARNHRHTADAMTELARLRQFVESMSIASPASIQPSITGDTSVIEENE